MNAGSPSRTTQHTDDEHAVGGEDVARLHGHDVADNELVNHDLLLLAVPDHLDLPRILLRVQRSKLLFL
jgi:hypothetical protein